MVFVPTSNTVLVEPAFLQGDSVVENTLYFEYTSAPTEAQVESLATTFATAWVDNLSPLQSADVSLFKVKATSQNAVDSPTFEYFLTPPEAGGIAEPRTPGNVTWTIRFGTAARGRSFRGRNYWVGLYEGVVSGDGITSTHANNIIAGYQAMIAEVNIEDCVHVVVSKFSAGIPRVAGVTTPVTSYGYADLFIDSQRRRLTGRGS